FARGVSNGERQTIARQRAKIIAIPAQRAHLAASRTVVQGVRRSIQALHKPLLDIAGDCQVGANIHYQRIARHFRTSTHMSIFEAGNRHDGWLFFVEKLFYRMSKTWRLLRLPHESATVQR